MRRVTTMALSLAVVASVALCAGGVAAASAAKPWWHLTSRTIPTHIAPGGEGTIVVQAVNLGNVSTSGVFSFSDTLPEHVTLQEASFFARPSQAYEEENSEKATHVDFGPSGPNGALGYCKSSAGSITCSSERPSKPEARFLLQPVFSYDFIELRLKVKAEAGAVSGALNRAEVGGGGGASAVSASFPVPVEASLAGFGIEEFSLVPEEEGGEVDARAGSHPYQLTNVLSFNRDSTETLSPPAPARDLHFKLPPGLVGNATALPQCSEQDFADVLGGGPNLCPPDTAIGVAVVTASTFPGQEEHFTVPVFNLRPAPGEPARFGFEVLKNPAILDTSVRSGPGEDYGITVSVKNITQLVNFISATTTFWGTPGESSHNEARGWGCLVGGRNVTEVKEENEEREAEGLPPGPVPVCESSNEERPPAFLTLPTDCQAPFAPVLEGDSWPKETPGGLSETLRFAPVAYGLKNSLGQPVSLSGCNQLAFSPLVSAEPTAVSAASPSGLNFNLNFHDEGLKNPNGTAQSQLEDTSVVLPEGLTINPSAGVGLGGCTPADYARETVESLQGEGCPNDSKLGTVEIETPLLTQRIQGAIYIAQPYQNPFGSLVALYVVAKNPETGILVKLAGKVEAGGQSGVEGLAPGQLRTTFENNPQLPFDHFNFHFREGQQAPLITPATCRDETPEYPGSYATQAVLTPWANPLSVLTDTSTFKISQGAEGGACPAGAPPFHPGIEAGTLNNNAGSFSPFYLHLTRTDGEQEIARFTTNLPAGLTGDLTGIPFCSEASIALARTKSGAQEEAEPSCPAASQVGHTLVGTGVGAVLAYVPGKIYLAGPYNGDPFSLVSVTSAVVGPFDLGTVVIRFGLRIDPYTAQVSVDPTASEPIPTIIDGIVTHVRDIRVYIDRANFTLNPTSCNPLSIASTLTSDQGASATVSSSFQTASCQSLKFAPKFAVSTSGKTSKANGASLTVKLTYPSAPQGTQANIARVKVELPKQLPSRLTTLQKACTAAQFEANPAGCPAASIIGRAKAVTPLIPVPLEGPAYFVSHGGEAFPSLIMVLQGYGVKINLVGSTFISRQGVTSSTFKAVPDEPVGSFELTLPEGKYSALAANGNLCTIKLTMPTEFVAQNGAPIHQTTKISVTGCAKAKALTRAQKLSKALKACRKDKNRGKRAKCEQTARKRYGPQPKKKTAKKKEQR